MLTGGPGRIGRYRLRDLTRRGHRVAVLIRERRDCPAAERITEVVAEIDEVTGVVTGDRALQLQDGEVLLPSFGPTAAATARRAAEQHHPTPNAA